MERRLEHYTIILWVIGMASWAAVLDLPSPLISGWLVTGLTLLVSTTTYRVIELRAIRLGKRLTGSLSRGDAMPIRASLAPADNRGAEP